MNSKNLAFKVETKEFCKTIKVPSSKSHANRLLILAAICKEEVRIENLPESSDVTIMLECLSKIGLEIEKKGDLYLVKNSFPDCEKNISEELINLRTGDGGTTNRFLMGLLCRGTKTYELNADEGLRARPQEALVEILKDLGAEVSLENTKTCWYRLKGPYKIEQNIISIDAKISTQFVSSVMMATYDLGLKVESENLITSAKYLAMTEYYIDKFREEVRHFVVPVDYSGASYPIALAAATGSVLISNAKKMDPFQADGKLVQIVQEMGAQVSWREDGLYIAKGSSLTAVKCDCRDFPDLVPTLIFLCSYAQGVSTLKNVEVLRHKESDRLAEMFKILDLFEVPYIYHEKEDSLEINPSSKLKDFCSHTPFPDHRMIMVSYLYMRRNSGGEIFNSEHVKKSFPDFFQVMD